MASSAGKPHAPLTPPSSTATFIMPCSPHGDITGSSYIVIVMGVCGTGKSTLGRALAGALDVPFVDGDDLHPAANVAKMARGEPLDDVDREPWLVTVRETAVARVQGQPERARAGVVVACSALKKMYRTTLRAALATYVVYLKGDEAVLTRRMEARQGHFMKAGMLASQMRTLESPEDEPGVVTVSVEMSTEAQVQTVVDALGLSYLSV